MARDESTGGGLFSRVVQFVRHPATPWDQLDVPGAGADPALTREALKEMAVRRKRNDFVRRREFDALRAMRSSTAAQAASGRQSFFQSSFSSNSDERALTLRKIDEIEAQMSMQWWNTKGGGNTAPASGSPSLPGVPDTGASVSPRMPAAPPGPAAGTPLFTAGDTEAPTTVLPMESVAPAGATAFGGSQLFAVEVAELMHDPELEEAAIRFANGDDAGAEAALQEVLAVGGARHGHQETWLSLFDLYRATGQQSAFERVALDFAQHFGRSAPQWVSLPDQLGRMAAGAPLARAENDASAAGEPVDWTAPALLDAWAVRRLAAATAIRETIRLDWSALTAMAPDAAATLLELLAHWRSRPVHLEWRAADRLTDALRAATPSGDAGVDAVWWQLRMEVYRVTHAPDAFELAALDYCVTYEVSPPSWEPVACHFTAPACGSVATGLVEGDTDSTLVGDSTLYPASATVVDGEASRIGSTVWVALAGLVLGDAPPLLFQLDSRWGDADTMVIDCSRLVRVDFAAAGALLNWVVAHRTARREVRLVGVHRMLAPFFSVIGIADHARVESTSD